MNIFVLDKRAIFVSSLIFLMVMFSNVNCLELLVRKINIEVNLKLVDAVSTNDLKKIQEALKEGDDLNCATGFYLFYNYKSIISHWYSIDRESVIFKGSELLLYAIVSRKFDIAKYLIKAGASIEDKDQFAFDIILLSFATAKSYLELQEVINFLFLELTVDINEVNKNGNNLLDFACSPRYFENEHLKLYTSASNLEFLKFLVFNGLDVYGKCFAKLTKDRIEDIEEESGIFNFLKKLKDLLKIRNVSYRDMVLKINFYLKNKLVAIYPKDLGNIVFEYVYYSDNYKDFFELSNEEINDIVDLYKQIIEQNGK